jgi:hypothetical protein
MKNWLPAVTAWFQRSRWRILVVLMVLSACIRAWHTWEHPPQYPARQDEQRQ